MSSMFRLLRFLASRLCSSFGYNKPSSRQCRNFSDFDPETSRRACHFTFLGARHIFSGFLSLPHHARARASLWFVKLGTSTVPSFSFVFPLY